MDYRARRGEGLPLCCSQLPMSRCVAVLSAAET